jgi:hypothetical protein
VVAAEEGAEPERFSPEGNVEEVVIRRPLLWFSEDPEVGQLQCIGHELTLRSQLIRTWLRAGNVGTGVQRERS